MFQVEVLELVLEKKSKCIPNHNQLTLLLYDHTWTIFHLSMSGYFFEKKNKNKEEVLHSSTLPLSATTPPHPPPLPSPNPSPHLPGNIITPGLHGGANTHRHAAKSTLAGVPRVCPGGEHVFVATGLSGSEMAHQGVMGSALSVAGHGHCKCEIPRPEAGHSARQLQSQKLHRQKEGMDVLDLLASHHYLCLR